MKVEQLKQGDELQVGDIVQGTNAFGVNIYKITRVTKTFALAKVNHTDEAKFNRVIGWHFTVLPKRSYSNTRYVPFRVVGCLILALFLTACSPRVTRSKQIYYNNTLNYLRTRLDEHKIDSAEYKRLIDNRPELAEYFGYKPY